MASLTCVHASDGNNAELAKLVEEHALKMGHEVTHVSLNALDFPVYTVKRDKRQQTRDDRQETGYTYIINLNSRELILGNKNLKLTEKKYK